MANTSRLAWEDDDTYWQSNYSSRPYASSERRDYEFYRPGYRYGYDAANRFPEHDWNDIEPDLARGWNDYETRGTSTWDQIKGAVRDAWDRVTGRRTVVTK